MQLKLTCFLVKGILFSYSLLLACCVYAEITVRIVDQHNKPVENAVVSMTARGSVVKNDRIVVDQVNKQFVPKISIAYAGQDVYFPNSDDIRHHVYSFSKARAFEIKLYSGTPATPISLGYPGVVVLGCNVHDKMIGYIYVLDKHQVAVLTDNKGIAYFSAASGNVLKIWHPQSVKGPEQVLSHNFSEHGNRKLRNFKIELLPLTKTRKKFGSRFTSHR